MNSDALNFDLSAEEDDGSCEYSNDPKLCVGGMPGHPAGGHTAVRFALAATEFDFGFSVGKWPVVLGPYTNWGENETTMVLCLDYHDVYPLNHVWGGGAAMVSVTMLESAAHKCGKSCQLWGPALLQTNLSAPVNPYSFRVGPPPPPPPPTPPSPPPPPESAGMRCTEVYTQAFLATLGGVCSSSVPTCNPDCQGNLTAMLTVCRDQRYQVLVNGDGTAKAKSSVNVTRSFDQKAADALVQMGPRDCDYTFEAGTACPAYGCTVDKMVARMHTAGGVCLGLDPSAGNASDPVAKWLDTSCSSSCAAGFQELQVGRTPAEPSTV